ncbi:acyl-CoA thioesterase/bile acid-CoA:amino acid N-acyltransferase family protein [Embleya sp. NPDC059237]|uniref:acyl-CoA thioesterase/bile acid-CoA:amino acid N-acyltransferase family protein n=1 Tax=Embleya sp. NPDC059237 TaxID=3346784 RepID=UPI0036856EC2
MRNRMRGWARVLVVLVLLGAGTTQCARGPGGRPVVEVDAPTALVDRAVHMRIGGLTAGEKVGVDLRAVDVEGKPWRGHATFRANSHGVVDVDTAAPLSGTYRRPDGMGLFWSMNPRSGDPEQAYFRPPYRGKSGFDLTLTATANGRRPVSRTLTRKWTEAGVSARDLTLAADAVVGSLFLPAAATPRRPAVLVFGGSEGGPGPAADAALFAAHGYPALALGYFHAPGLPDTLANIPLEYFRAAVRILAGQPGVDPDHIVAQGYSRGSEAALLLAQHYPDVVHGAIVYSPSDMANGGFPNFGQPAWTKDGRALAGGHIRLDHVAGPVLAIAGADDRLWPSADAARAIVKELDDRGNPHPHRALVFPDAGHGVGTFPYLAAGTRYTHPLTNEVLDVGGTRAANAAAQEQGWPQVLALLASLTR